MVELFDILIYEYLAFNWQHISNITCLIVRRYIIDHKHFGLQKYRPGLDMINTLMN